MNKKIIIIISVVALVLVVVIYSISKSKSSSLSITPIASEQTSPSTLSSDSTSGQSILYDKSSGQVTSTSDQGTASIITTLSDKKAFGVSISPDQKNLLYNDDTYTSDHVLVSGENPDAQTLQIYSISSNSVASTLKNVFSSAWLSPTEVVFQDLSDNNIEIYDISQNKQIKKINNPLDGEINIFPLDANNIVVQDYVTDTTPTTAKILNLTNSKTTDLPSGDSLHVKTKLGSNYLAYDLSGAAILFDWQNNVPVKSFSSFAYESDWSDQANTLFFIDVKSNLQKVDLTTGKTAQVASNIVNPVIIKALSDGRVYIGLDQSTQIY